MKSWRSWGLETLESRKMLTPFQCSRKSTHILMSLWKPALSLMCQWGKLGTSGKMDDTLEEGATWGNHPACELESAYQRLKFSEGG